MVNPFQTTSVKRVTAQDHDLEVWKLRLKGYTYSEIAEKTGISTALVAQCLKRQVLARHEEIRDMSMQGALIEHDRLEAMARQVLPRATGGEIVGPDGAPELDENGNPRRYGYDPKAIDKALQIHDRKARLLGLDRVRIDVTTNGGSVSAPGNADLSRLSPTEVALLEHLHRKALGAAKADTVEGEVVPAG